MTKNTNPSSAKDQIAAAIQALLSAVGEDPSRAGLIETPNRVAQMYTDLLDGYQTDPAAMLSQSVFPTNEKEMVLVRDIEFASLCEHHLLPFFGIAHIAYIPNGQLVGVSKIPQMVDSFAQRLQMQERLTHQIGECLQKAIQPMGVGVVLEGFHLCSRMRGVRKSNARLVTSAMFGVFLQDPRTRGEFMAHLQRTTDAPFW